MVNQPPARPAHPVQQARNRQAEQEALVRQLRAEPGLSALRQVLERRLAEAQLALLRCPQAELPIVQARARVVYDLIQEFFVEPLRPDA